MSGNLWLWNEEGKYWKRRYFFLADSHILHHYNSSQEAYSSLSATKKNRLLLNSVEITTSEEEDQKFLLEVSVLDGRMKWRLGAISEESRQNWIRTLEN
mmetsp:Transcript_8196/g.9346  ORF Transcript_8196/g.9346 Transcript_8196/m.9346 type:complete len:99 (+) Transcript_8196:229-525(+)